MGGIALGNRIVVTMFIIFKRRQVGDYINVKINYNVNPLSSEFNPI
jgi:hypothetical protein